MPCKRCHNDKYDWQRRESMMRLPTEQIADAHLGARWLNKIIKTAFFPPLLTLLFCYLSNVKRKRRRRMCKVGILLLSDLTEATEKTFRRQAAGYWSRQCQVTTHMMWKYVPPSKYVYWEDVWAYCFHTQTDRDSWLHPTSSSSRVCVSTHTSTYTNTNLCRVSLNGKQLLTRGNWR